MNFNTKTPCSNCPFRNRDGAVRLTPERAEEITTQQGEFPCHKTVDYDEDDNGEPIARTRQSSVCAGSIIYQLKTNQMNQCLRIAERLGVVDLEPYDTPQQHAKIIDDVEEMMLPYKEESNGL